MTLLDETTDSLFDTLTSYVKKVSSLTFKITYVTRLICTYRCTLTYTNLDDIRVNRTLASPNINELLVAVIVEIEESIEMINDEYIMH